MRKTWLVALVPAFVGAVVLSQAAEEKKPDVNIAALDELRALRTATKLGIDKQRAAQALKLVQAVDEQKKQYTQWATKEWKTRAETVKAAIKVWAAGGQATADQQAAAKALYQAYAQWQRSIDETAHKAAVGIVRLARAGGHAAETAEEASRRKQAERVYDGARSAAEFVLRAAETLHGLMPDDYALVRFSEAQRIASTLTGQGQAPRQLVDAVLVTLDDLVGLPPQAYLTQRQALLAEISQRLSLAESPKVVESVPFDEVVEWVKGPATVRVLSVMAGNSLPATTMPPEEFEVACQELALLAMTYDLQLGPGQTRALAQLVSSLQRDKQLLEQTRQELGQRAMELISDVRKAIGEGKTLEASVADKVQAILAEDDTAIGEFKVAAYDYINRMRRMLTPQQRMLVDWVAPGEVLRLVPPRAKIAMLRRRAAMIANTIDFYNSIKYQLPKRYMNVKVQYTQEFVSRFVPPDSPQFEQAMDFALELVTQMRFVPREEWDAGLDAEYATRLLHGLGVLPSLGPRQPTGQELYGWEDMYRLLTSKGAGALAVLWLGGESR